MEVAVIGGTGTLGRLTVAALAARGHRARTVSRRATGPDGFAADLRSGAGLDAALAGVKVVIDASNAGYTAKPARAVLVEGGRRLLAAARRAGVAHHVCISIVGIERVPLGYYRVKLEQEQAVAAAGVPHTVVRSTQFHTLPARLFAATARARVLPGGSARLQPVDPSEVAEWVAGVVEAGPGRGRVDVAGPEVLDLSALARIYRDATGRRGVIVPLAPLGRTARALRAGALTAAQPDHRGTTTFAQWLR